MDSLAHKKCQPCEGIGKTLARDQIEVLLQQTPGWMVSGDGKAIERAYVMKNFMAAVGAIEKIAAVAEGENHHPDIHLTGYRKLRVELSTHALGGLTENDFIVAAKLNELEFELKG